MNWIGLDIGGANIKVAIDENKSFSLPFALWKHQADLPAKLAQILRGCPVPYRLAVTMTGELADCFSSKQNGVNYIVQAVEQASVNEALFYQTTGSFVTAAEAVSNWQQTAAANWHALARYAARFMKNETGILIDVGSTTTDIIPVKDGLPCSNGFTDLHRLQSGELVYTGVERSPTNGLLKSVVINGKQTMVANELFSTALDAHVYLDNIAPCESCDYTADGRPATKEYAAKRLARTVCADTVELMDNDIRAIASAVLESQVSLITDALNRVIDQFPGSLNCVVVSGVGNWLARNIVRHQYSHAEIIELAEQVTPEANACAPAFAVLKLAEAVFGVRQCGV